MTTIDFGVTILYLIISIVFLRMLFHFVKFWTLLGSSKRSRIIKTVDDIAAESLLKLTLSSQKKTEEDYKKEREKTEKLLKEGKITKEEAEENPLKKLLYNEKTVYRYKIFMPCDSSDLNLETLFYIIKNTIALLFVCAMWFSLPTTLSTSKWYLIFIGFLVWSLLFLFFNKLVLRHQRYWWWAPWNIFLHESKDGIYSIDIRFVFLLLFFKLDIYLVLMIAALYLFLYRAIRHPLGRFTRNLLRGLLRLLFAMYCHFVFLPLTRIILIVILAFWRKPKKKTKKKKRKKTSQ